MLSGDSTSKSSLLTHGPHVAGLPCSSYRAIYSLEVHQSQRCLYDQWIQNHAYLGKIQSNCIQQQLICNTSPAVPLRALCPVSPVAPAEACNRHDKGHHDSLARQMKSPRQVMPSHWYRRGITCGALETALSCGSYHTYRGGSGSALLIH